MPEFRSAMVFLGADHDERELLDDDVRQRLMREGMDAVRTHVQGIRIEAPNSMACTFNVRGTPAALKTLQTYIEENRLGVLELGVYENAPLRGA